MGHLDRPVSLYVKKHQLTGLKYFGRTTENPFEYRGSGAYWTRHLEKYGNNVSTKVIGTYTDSAELRAAAISYSAEHDIAASTKWANLLPEDGSIAGEGWSPNGAHRDQIAALDAAVQRRLQQNEKKNQAGMHPPPAYPPARPSSGLNPVVWVAVVAGVVGAIWFFNQSSQPLTPTPQSQAQSCSDLLNTAVKTERAGKWVEPSASDFMATFSEKCDQEYSIWVDWHSIRGAPGAVSKCADFYQYRIEPRAIELARQDGSCKG